MKFSSDVSLASIQAHLRSTQAKAPETEVKVLKYCDMIMPLMFETWMEVKPNQTSTITGELRTSLSEDASIMLKIVLDVMMELHDMVELTGTDTKAKYLAKNLEKFDVHLVTPFPYVQDDSSKKSPESGGAKCVYQNLSVAILYLSFIARHKPRFSKHREKVFKFIIESIDTWKPKDAEFNSLMRNFINRLFAPEMIKIFSEESKQVFHQLVKNCNVDQMTHDPKLELVCGIIEKSNTTAKDSIYSMIIPQMVKKLGTNSVIPVHLIDTITTLAKCGNKIVLENLEINIAAMIESLLTRMRFVGNLDKDESVIKCKIANLVYWIDNKETLIAIRATLKNEKLSNHIREIIDMKISC